MARIPESEIERLKTEVALERLVGAAGIELKRAGKDLVGRCPFHEDKGPSLVVSPAKNLWHCMGACQMGGSPIDWVMRMNGVSFRHAVELLRTDPSLAAGSQPVKHSTVRKLPAPVAPDADDQALLNQVIGYYHETLKQSPEALRYLEARGIGAPEALERHRLGFANRTLGLRLPKTTRLAGAAVRARLQKLGILRDSGHEHFNGSLVIPVLDESGNVTEVYGRKITAGLRPGTPLHLYLPGPHRGVWNVQALPASKEMILCEALIDALTFWCTGYRNVTAAYGIEGFTDGILAAFKCHGTERVLIAYDRDDAGERAAAKVAQRLEAEGIEPWRIQFPKGMDANEYALKLQPAAKALGVAIRKAVWLGKGEPKARGPIEASPAPIAVTLDVEPRAPARAGAVSSLAADLAAKEEVQKPAAPAIEAAAALPAAAVPPAVPDEIAAEVTENEVTMSLGDRRYRVRGLAKNLSFEVLRVNLLASRAERFYVDTLDLYSAKQRSSYLTHAALQLEIREDVLKTDVGRVLMKLEGLQEKNLRRTLEPKAPAAVAIAEVDREAALALLRSPDLIARIGEDLEACGLVGERTNKLVAYLAATSRKLDQPLAVLVQSSSAAGKSALMEAVLALMPAEDRVKYSAMTGQSLFYLGNGDLKHKILAIAEEEGAARAAYALKLLHSEGELTIASTGKDPATGNLVTQEYHVEGPTMLFTTTTAAEVDPELQNRCLVLAVDESREQTQAIHRLQRDRRTLEGLARKARRRELQKLHQNAQRLLRSLEVLNPYAERLTFPDQATRMRRDHEKYLTLIDTIALLHQHQREVKTMLRAGEAIEYVEASAEDVALANALAHEVLGRSLDELPPQTRRLLESIDAHVRAECKRASIERAAFRFSRRALREAIGWGDTQLRVHLERLIALEYVIAHRGRQGALYEYELVYDGAGEDGRPFVPGLIEVEALGATPTTANFAGVNEHFAGAMRPGCGPVAGGVRGAESSLTTLTESASWQSTPKSPKTHIKGNGSEPSYTQDGVVPLAAASRR
jgi:DNA primase catalytic core